MSAATPFWVRDVSTWLVFTAALFAVIGSIWGTIKLVLRTTRNQFVESVTELMHEQVPGIVESVMDEKLKSIRRKQDKVVADVASIREQMLPNGGMSLRDRVDKLTDVAGIEPAFPVEKPQ